MYQKIIIAGNLGSDPEMRYTPEGTPVTTFSVATNESWKDDSGTQHKRTTWWKVTAWRRLAETCNEYLAKGKQVLIEGTMIADVDTGGPRIWQAKDGSSRASFEIVARTVKFLGTAGDSGKSGPPPVDEGDLPF